MNDIDIEKKLAESGFTAKEIKFIRNWVRKEKTTYLNILEQVSKIFIGGCFLRLLLIIYCVASFLSGDAVYFFGALFASVFALVVLEVFAPFVVGAKTFLYVRGGWRV